MNYSIMSDFEINKAVAECLGVKFECFKNQVFGHNEVKSKNVINVVGVIDYCNNPSDAWPIIIENKISLQPPMSNGVKCWWASDTEDNHVIGDSSPLRAAMIVFLMIKEQEGK